MISLYNTAGRGARPFLIRSWSVLRQLAGADVPDSFTLCSPSAGMHMQLVPWVALGFALGSTLAVVWIDALPFMGSKNSELAYSWSVL